MTTSRRLKNPLNFIISINYKPSPNTVPFTLNDWKMLPQMLKQIRNWHGKISVNRFQFVFNKEFSACFYHFRLFFFFSNFFAAKSRRGIVQGVVFSLLNVLTAQFIFLTYGSEIMSSSGTTLPTGASSIFMALVQLLATFGTYVLIDKTGRKFLLILSLIGCAVSHASMVAYLYFKSHVNGHNTSLFHSIPILAMASVIFMASIGIIPLSFICMAESYSTKMRPFGMTFGNVVLNIITFIVIKMYPILQHSIGLPMCLMLFCACCALGAIYVKLFVEETKGKDLNIAKQTTQMTSRDELFATDWIARHFMRSFRNYRSIWVKNCFVDLI